uniref:SHSP domain-containing protein n=1 Tax=Arcella intermedia TaxID=1963864 RepID=A0A6B2LUK9_9EUKA
MDVTEDDKSFSISAELPGIKKEDIKIHVDGHLLTISAERKEKKVEEDKEKHYHYSERRYGKIQRSIELPTTVDVDSPKTSFEDGVLHLEFIKKVDEKKRKVIKIT